MTVNPSLRLYLEPVSGVLEKPENPKRIDLFSAELGIVLIAWW